MNNIEKFIYLFLVDLVQIQIRGEITYEDFTKREPKYGASMLEAYRTAFSYPSNNQLTHGLIQAIHKSAMSFLIPNAGNYKKAANHFILTPSKCKQDFNVDFNMTTEGFKEFLKRWFYDHLYPNHGINIEQKADLDIDEWNSFLILPTNNRQVDFKKITFSDEAKSYYINNKNLKPADIFRRKENNPEENIFTVTEQKFINLKNLLEEVKNKFEDYSIRIDSTIHDESPEEVNEAVTNELSDIFLSYNQQEKSSSNEDEKIEMVAEHVQRINQVHPFEDGNIRTCYILLNKLLDDNNLSLALLANPNMFDGCSKSELVSEIKQGQIIFQNLMARSKKLKEENFSMTLSQIHAPFTSLACTPQALFDIVDYSLIVSFLDIISSNFNKKENFLNHFSMFSDQAQKNNHKNNIIQLIQHYMKEYIPDMKDTKDTKTLNDTMNAGNFSLALRQACVGKNSKVIEILLDNHIELSIDLEEKSSKGISALDYLKNNKFLTPSLKEKLISSLETKINECKQGVELN